jgi:hypothetical protein
MTQGRPLLRRVVTTAYILIAIQIEERELVSMHGEDYQSYGRRVPMLIPTADAAAGTAPLQGREGRLRSSSLRFPPPNATRR